jgi:hypothetical protein
MQEAKDITIIGAGPTGLFGAFYAGMRGASHRLIDNLDQVGGQLTALYPEKYIFDVAGFPQILAKDFVKGLAEQGLRWNPPVHLAEKVIGLKRSDENGKPQFTIVTDKDEYPSRAVLIAGGIGAFTPRKLPLKDVDQWNDKGLHDRVLNPQTFAGKRILIVGGGDSAFDWAVNLQGVAKSIRDDPPSRWLPCAPGNGGSGPGDGCGGVKMELRTFWEMKAIVRLRRGSSASRFTTTRRRKKRRYRAGLRDSAARLHLNRWATIAELGAGRSRRSDIKS